MFSDITHYLPFLESQAKGNILEIGVIAAGTTVELSRSHFFPSTFTEAQIEAFMAVDFSTQQAVLAAATQPGQFYGVYFDGTGWSG